MSVETFWDRSVSDIMYPDILREMMEKINDIGETSGRREADILRWVKTVCDVFVCVCVLPIYFTFKV